MRNLREAKWLEKNPKRKEYINFQKDKVRVALYSHDTMGLGHIRRNLLIAQSLVRSPLHVDIMMIAGAKEIANFKIPSCVDCLTVPSLHKGLDGGYKSQHLNIPLNEIISLRSNTIRAALEAFKPDVLIVDNVPRGAVGELSSSLEALKNNSYTKIILGLRDILDDPLIIRKEWNRANNLEAIRNYYDAIFVYGDEKVFETGREYGFPVDIRNKLRYTGYFNRIHRHAITTNIRNANLNNEIPNNKFILCLVGGGQDGASLGNAFIKSTLPSDMHGVLITGPFMPSEQKKKLYKIASQKTNFHIQDFVSEPNHLINKSECIIAMGGYNTISEILSFKKPSLIVPRVKPRREQLIRAKRFNKLGLLEYMHPDNVSPLSISNWILNNLSQAYSPKEKINFNGLTKLPKLIEDVLNQPSMDKTDPVNAYHKEITIQYAVK